MEKLIFPLMSESASSAAPHWTTRHLELAARLRRTPRILIASDFDGTLAPLVALPEEASALPAASHALLSLAAQKPRVRLAILTGRSLADMEVRLGVLAEHAILAGNHGLEIRGAGLDWTHPHVPVLRPDLAALAETLRDLTEDVPGVEVEDKHATLTVHHRRASSSGRAEMLRRLTALQIPRSIKVRPGKMILEYRPAVPWDKGHALRRIMQRVGVPSAAVMYLGDDTTDEDAFREVGSCGLAVKVAPLDHATAANLHCTDPADAAEMLQWLGSCLA